MKDLPFEFVLEELAPAGPETKAMFGAYAIYVDDKIVLILRQKDQSSSDNGVWLATKGEHHDSLRKEFPSMRSIAMFGPGPTGWQILPEDADDFEESVLRACSLVLARDSRIGKVPARQRALRGRKKSASKKSETKTNMSKKSKTKKSKTKKSKPRVGELAKGKLTKQELEKRKLEKGRKR